MVIIISSSCCFSRSKLASNESSFVTKTVPLPLQPPPIYYHHNRPPSNHISLNTGFNNEMKKKKEKIDFYFLIYSIHSSIIGDLSNFSCSLYISITGPLTIIFIIILLILLILPHHHHQSNCWVEQASLSLSKDLDHN